MQSTRRSIDELHASCSDPRLLGGLQESTLRDVSVEYPRRSDCHLKFNMTHPCTKLFSWPTTCKHLLPRPAFGADLRIHTRSPQYGKFAESMGMLVVTQYIGQNILRKLRERDFGAIIDQKTGERRKMMVLELVIGAASCIRT